MFCSYSAAVAIPELGLYSLDALNFSDRELNGMFTCLIVVNVGSVFVTRRWADVYIAYSAGISHVFASYRF